MILLNDNTFLYLLFTFLFPLATLLSMKKKSVKEKGFMDRSSTNAWKGIFIILICIHHYVQLMAKPGILLPYRWAGYLAVAGFFLFSGYGLMSSLLRKKDYLNGFFLQKSLRVYFPTITAILTLGLITQLLGYGDLNAWDVVLRSLTLTWITRFYMIWYVTATLIFYLFFFLSFNWLPKKNGLLLLFALNSLYVVVGWAIGLGSFWINTALLFPLGCALSYSKEWFLENTQRHYWKIATFLFVSFLAIFLIGVYGIVPLVTNTFAGLLMGLLVAIFSVRFKLTSELFSFFGRISFELYLVHAELYNILYQMFGINSWIGTLLMFGFIILLAYGLSKMNNAIIVRLNTVLNPRLI